MSVLKIRAVVRTRHVTGRAIAVSASLLLVLMGIQLMSVPVARAAGTVGLGTQTVQSNHDSNSSGLAEAFQATAGASGAVTSLSVYVDSTSQASSVEVGLYSDAAGQPGSLLTGGTISSPTSGAWNTVTVPAATITSGDPYWISVLSPLGSGTFAFRDAPSGPLSEGSSQSNLTSLPATWTPGPRWDNTPISAYATVGNSPPDLSVSPSTLAEGAIIGAAAPSPSTISVSNAGGGSLSFSASSDSQWLTVTPATGTAPQSLSVTASAAGLVAGTYTGHITVTASGVSGSPQVVTVTLVVNSPAPADGVDWTTVGHDSGRSGTAPAESQIGTANAASLSQNWSTSLDGKVTAQPLFLSAVQVMGAIHDVVIAATNQDTVYALDANTGAVLWSDHLATAPASCGIPGGLGISATPAVDLSADRIYAVTDDGDLRTLSLADGSQVAPAVPIVADPATNYVWGGLNLSGGSLYIPTGSNGCDQAPWQGGIYQVDVSGSVPAPVKHWVTVPSLPASEAGGGIWGSGGVSVDAATGHVFAASADDATNLTGDEGYTPYSGSLLALDANLNLLGWYQPPQSPNYNCGSSPPCDQDFAATPLPFQPPGCPTMLAAGNKNGNLYVTSAPNLEADTGYDGSNVQVITLNQDIDDIGKGGISGTPVYDPTTNMLYLVDTGPGLTGVAGGLVALAVQPDCSLSVAWSRTVGTSISNSPNSPPTIANGVVYVGVNDGSVAAFNASTGATLWNSGSNGFAVYDAPIVANGRVIAGSWSGATSAAGGTVTAWTPSTPLGLGAAPNSVSFTTTAGAGNPPAQTVSLTNGGSQPITFAAGSDESWLSVTPTSGTVPATLTLQADTAGLAAGNYSAVVTVTPSQGAAQTVSVQLDVAPQPTPPGVPTQVKAAPGDGSATVSWTAPADGGSQITSYTVTPFVGASAQKAVTVTGSPPSTFASVTGLTNGTSYSFTVAATNSVGTGPASSATTPITPTATSNPVMDVSVSADATGGSVTTPTFSTAQAGETLVAFVSSDGPGIPGGQSATVSGAGLSWKLAGRSNSEYGTAEVWWATASSPLTGVTVSAAEGQSGYYQMLTVKSFEGSSGVGAVATGSAASGAPTVSLKTTRDNSLIYGVGNDWDSAQGRTAGPGQALTDQWVETTTGDTFWVQQQTNAVPASGTPVTVNDTAPTADRWNLTAVEVVGSAPSAPTAPSPPTGVTAVAGNQSASVSWTAPSDGGSPITAYTVTPYIGSVAQASTSVTGSQPATSVALSGLTNGSAYTFTVIAVNAIGPSAASSPSPAVTPGSSHPPATDVHVAADGSGPTVTTSAFSTAKANELLVAFVSSDGPGGAPQTATVTGAGLTWKLAARADGQSGTAEIWTATAPSVLSAVTVSSTAAQTGYDQSLSVLSFEGSSGPGATATAGASSGAPTVGLTTTGQESLVFAVGEDWDQAISRTVGTGQSLVHQWVDTRVGETFWVQQITYPVASPAPVMLNDSAPTTDRWNLAALEVTGS